MVKERFHEFFREYREYSRIWNTDHWREFEKRILLTGFISYYETKKIKRTKEGYKEFFGTIFLDADRLHELINLKEEELLEQSRLNIEIFEKEKSKKEGIQDILFALITGIICHFYLNWKWLFIIVGIYSFFKASLEVSKLKKSTTIGQDDFLDKHPEIKKSLKETQTQVLNARGCFLIIIRVLILGGFAALIKFITGLIF